MSFKKKFIPAAAIFASAVILAGCGSAASSASTSSASASSATSAEVITEYLDVEPVEYKAADYVTVGAYDSFTVDINDDDYKISDDDVTEYIEQVLSANGYTGYNFTEKARTETGDTVNIDMTFTIDGVDTSEDQLEDVNIVLGDNSVQLDGFDDQLTGVDVPGTYEFTLTFPDDYAIENYAGKTADFKVTVNGIAETYDMTYDLLTDDYVSKTFGYDTVDEFIQAARERLEENAESLKTQEIQDQITDQLIAAADFKGVPDGLKEARINEYKNIYIYQANLNGESLEDYLADYDLTEDDWTSRIDAYVDETIQKELVITYIAQAEGMDKDTDGYNDYVSQMKAEFTGTDNEFNIIYPEDYCRLAFYQQSVMDELSSRISGN